MDFRPFNKIARLSRECIVTEKIDGTNGIIGINNGVIWAGSRNRWLWNSTQDQIHNDNYGFAQWVALNRDELMKLGEGVHYGEWWGKGIQRGYNMIETRFSLFNVARWSDDEARPKCCSVVPVLAECMFDTKLIESVLYSIKETGSQAHPGYMYPEGIVVFHKASGQLFKKTIMDDESPKSLGKQES